MLDYALPFPPRQFAHYHDHWLALTALALGEIEYVDQPLYDYVQHRRAALGHAAANLRPWERPGAGVEAGPGGGVEAIRGGRGAYSAYARLRALAEVLIERAGPRLERPARRTLRRFARADRSPGTFIWLLVRPARRLIGRNETMGAEAILVRGLLWRAGKGMVALPTLGGRDSHADAINDRGQIVGRSGVRTPNEPPADRDLVPPDDWAHHAFLFEDGTMRDLQVISGHPLLVASAMEAVRMWKYKPTLLEGVPVEVSTQIDVNFTLSEQQ